MGSQQVFEELAFEKDVASFPNFPVEHLFTLFSAGNMSYSHGIKKRVESNKEETYDQFGIEDEEEEVVHAVPQHEDKIVGVSFANTADPVLGDAVITDAAGLSLEMAPADCYILLMSDEKAVEEQNSTLALVHISRKNVNTDLIWKTVSRFGLGPKSVQVALSPGIKSCCLKFSWFQALLERIRHPNGIVASEFSFEVAPKEIKIKLQREIIDNLLESGIPRENITASRKCTKCDYRYDENGREEYYFFSHRRYEEEDEKIDGRNLVLAQN